MQVEVNSAADFVCKRCLAAERRLRQKVRSAHHAVTPDLKSAGRGPTKSRPAHRLNVLRVPSAYGPPRAHKLTVSPDPFPAGIIDHAKVDAIHVTGHMRQHVETEKRVPGSCLPIVVLKNAKNARLLLIR